MNRDWDAKDKGKKMKHREVVLSQHSPLMVVDTDVIGKDGELIPTPRVCSFCRCGASNHKPLCDGTHAEIGFVGTREGSEKDEPEMYRGKDITIVYNRQLCTGAGFCGELEAVFGTHDAPIYEPDAAPVEDIIATIRKCPSGALQYIVDGEHFVDYYDKTQIVVHADGPICCQGSIELIDDQDSDKLLADGDQCTLCRCGGSERKPLCDGSHLKNGFTG